MEVSSLSGHWRGIIRMQDQEFPFNFRLAGTPEEMQMEIYNAADELKISDLQWKCDALRIPMHIFDTEIQAVVESGSIKAYWIKKIPTTTYSLFQPVGKSFRFPTG